MSIARAAWVLVVFGAVCGGCGALSRTWIAPDAPDGGAETFSSRHRAPPGAEALRSYAAARRFAGLGQVAQAAASAEAAIAADDGFLEAHRLLQDLTARTRADWWLRERYERRFEADPNDADACYLLARIESDPSRQLELFTRATVLDPGHPYAALGRAIGLARRGDVAEALSETRRSTALAPWLALPWIWLGTESLKREERESALRFFTAARDRAPDDPRPWLGVSQATLALERWAESSDAALEALRLAPGDIQLAGAAADGVVRSPVAANLEAALSIMDAALRDGAPAGPALLIRGRVAAALGRPAVAVTSFEDALAAGMALSELAQPLRSARVRAGEFREAVLRAIEALPEGAESQDNLYAARWERLRTAASADLEAPAALLELAESMASVGWIEESRVVLGAARLRAPADPVIAARAVEEEAFAAFLDDLARIARDSRGSAGSRPALVGEILARISEASQARLGFDAAEGAVVRRYPLLGTFTVSTASGGAFESAFGSHGLACLVGARSGSAADLVLGRIVVVRADSQAQVMGESIEFDECWIESEGLPPDAAGLRRGLAGLTLDRLVLLQLDAARRDPRAREDGLPFEPRPAASREELRSLDTPSDAAQRIEARIALEGRASGAALDAVRRHELVHVYDAARLLPFSAHPFAAAWFVISHGFDGAASERALEARAQALSIAAAREPRLALAALVSFLPQRDGDTPHTAAYREVAQVAVDLVIDDPASFPSIDLRWNVLQQFDALTCDEARELGRRVATRF